MLQTLQEKGMRRGLLEILCCPTCNGNLDWVPAETTESVVSEAEIVCSKCNTTFRIEKGIPRLYIADDVVIKGSDRSKFAEFIVTPERISAETSRKIPQKRRHVLVERKISLLSVLGWLSLLLSGVLLVIDHLHAGFSINPHLLKLPTLMAIVAFVLFLVDFLIYRIAAKVRHKEQWQQLAELSGVNRLSEYDSRLNIKDKREEYNEELLRTHPKAKEISYLLDEYNICDCKGLNLGCGGEIHLSVSRPLFNRRCNMLGVDIHEDYLLEYAKVFETDTVQANALALPFKPETFDLAILADILEHLHHPFLGLCESSRVLRNGGMIVLCTPYRCRFSPNCLNPFIFIERVVSLYYDQVLGPRLLVSGFQEMKYYHTEFSKPELTALFEASDFEILKFHTYFAKSKMLTKLFSRIPVLRFMGTSIVVIGMKRDKSSSSNHIGPFRTPDFQSRSKGPHTGAVRS